MEMEEMEINEHNSRIQFFYFNIFENFQQLTNISNDFSKLKIIRKYLNKYSRN